MSPVLDDWLPEGHLARFVADLVDAVLDLGPVYDSYTETGISTTRPGGKRAEVHGSPARPPPGLPAQSRRVPPRCCHAPVRPDHLAGARGGDGGRHGGGMAANQGSTSPIRATAWVASVPPARSIRRSDAGTRRRAVTQASLPHPSRVRRAVAGIPSP